MKTNHENVIKFIRQAIVACKEDSVLKDVKILLHAAIQHAEKVGNKRNKRESQTTKFAEEAKKNNEKWQELLKKNLKLGDINEEGTSG